MVREVSIVVFDIRYNIFLVYTVVHCVCVYIYIYIYIVYVLN
jgi:hypothetical protein